MTSAPTHEKRGTTLAWLLYVVQLLGAAVLALLAITSVFMTDSCGSVANEAAVCNTGYFGSVLFGYWAALALLAVIVPILIVKAARRGKSPAGRALGGLLLTAALTVLFVALMVR